MTEEEMNELIDKINNYWQTLPKTKQEEASAPQGLRFDFDRIPDEMLAKITVKKEDDPEEYKKQYTKIRSDWFTSDEHIDAIRRTYEPGYKGKDET